MIMKRLLLWLVGLLLTTGVPALAQGNWQEIQPKRTRDYDDRKSEGYCAIRVWVDDLVIIHTRGGRVAFETVRGQRAKDAGTECSQPLPGASALADFKWRGVDGRGRVELLEAPDQRNRYTAIVRIEDPKSGGQEHHFRLTWRNLRPGSASPSGGGFGGQERWTGRDARGRGWGGGGRNAAIREVTADARGRGSLHVDRAREQRINTARVEIRQDGSARIDFRGSGNAILEGQVTGVRGEEYTVRIDRFAGAEASGEARIAMRSGRVQRIDVKGEQRQPGNSFRADFQAN